MPGMFIDVKVSDAAAADPAVVKTLVEVCPVNIFAQDAAGRLGVVEANLDECTLCDLCVQAAPPGSVEIVKLYQQ
jgi:NAD-dependent dihydropyrimidine dehydrogenase PreA subunit